ncbi:MAG: AI-2E family transporter [Methyloprofundus sp.]|nr:AI-2E family transporter [Methyloprofundus sp.]
MNIELNPQQQKIIATAITLLAAAVIIIAVVQLFIHIAAFLGAFSHVFLPLVVAAILALVLEPWFNWLRHKAHLPDALAVIFVFASLILPVVFTTVFFGSLIMEQLVGLIEYLPTLWENMLGWFQERRPKIDYFFKEHPFGIKIKAALNEQSGSFFGISDYLMHWLKSASSGVVSGVGSLMVWVVAPVYLAFFLLMPKVQANKLSSQHLPFLKPETAKDAIYLFNEFVALVVSFFRGQIIVALLQGILFAVGFSFAGLEYGAVLGVTLGFLNLVPYLGSMIGLGICLPIAWFQVGGGVDLLLIVMAVFATVQMIEGYLITPRIMGDRTGLHPMVIIVAIFFWGSALGGILGMILAIPLTAFLVVVWRLMKEKYIMQIF